MQWVNEVRKWEIGNGEWAHFLFPISYFRRCYNDDLYSNRFGVPDGFPVITFAVELLMIHVRIVDDE